MFKRCLCGLSAAEIYEIIRPAGFSEQNALTITNSIYKKGISDISDIPKISHDLINYLSDISETGLYKPVKSDISVDGSVKYLFRTESGMEFETVYLPEKRRHTVCVSTQSGCRMGCSFCATARYGYKGDLSVSEILNQIISIDKAGPITHIVFMGMGEPMDNLSNVLNACEIITAEWGMAIGKRNVTVSTVGIKPGVEKFLKESDCNLTLSLYSPFADERIKIVPAEKRYPSAEIIEAMKKYPLRNKRRLSVAYIMIKDINDTDRHLNKLTTLLKGSAIRVNLLSYHSTGNDNLVSSSDDRMQYFKHNLVISGISASVRKSRGKDIAAACGLLVAGKSEQTKSCQSHNSE